MHAVSALDALFDKTRSCERCDAPLPPPLSRGRPRRFCLICRPGGQEESRLLSQQRSLARPKSRPCGDCQVEVEREPGSTRYRQYCEPCALKRRVDAQEARNLARRIPGGSYAPPMEWCVECFSSLEPGRILYCSKKCQVSLMIRARSRQRARDRGGLVERRCAECTSAFTTDHPTRNYCGRTCQKRHDDRIKSTLRRSRQTGSEAVNPILVFERDGWRCQMCRRKTPRKLRGKHLPLSPELDHIIPLAAGGEHTYRNTQCLCHDCNNKKGVQVLGQMRLFG